MKHQQQSTKLSIWTAPLKKCVRRHTMFNPIFVTSFFATVICFIRICFVIYVRTWAVLYVNKRKIDLCHIKMPFEANRMQSGYIWVGDVWWAHLFSHSNLGENTLWEESSPASIWIVYYADDASNAPLKSCSQFIQHQYSERLQHIAKKNALSFNAFQFQFAHSATDKWLQIHIHISLGLFMVLKFIEFSGGIDENAK